MARVLDSVQALAITLWVGVMWTSGLLVAPALFRMLPDRTLAGSIAGQLFETTVLVGIACGACILVIEYFQRNARPYFRRPVVWLVVAMLIFALVGRYGIQPVLAELRQQAQPQSVMQSELGGRFAAWHAAAGVLYLVQCLLSAVLVISNHTNSAATSRRRIDQQCDIRP